jgi:hypothetical protein
MVSNENRQESQYLICLSNKNRTFYIKMILPLFPIIGNTNIINKTAQFKVKIFPNCDIQSGKGMSEPQITLIIMISQIRKRIEQGCLLPCQFRSVGRGTPDTTPK